MEAVARAQWDTGGWFGHRGPRGRPARAAGSAGFAHRVGGPGLIVASSAPLQTSAALATTVFAVYGPAGTGALRFAAAAPVLLLLVRPTIRGRSRRFWLTAATFAGTLVGLNFVLPRASEVLGVGMVVAASAGVMGTRG
jgi:inner membrane transporter RhtA